MKAKTLFYCTECGNEMPKWQGKCPACGAWNTVVEQPTEKPVKKAGINHPRGSAAGVAVHRPKLMKDVEITDELRFVQEWESWTGFWEAVRSRDRWF